ncbi:hypothetical protein STEG23_027060, partial [Scotinomys teguina]
QAGFEILFLLPHWCFDCTYVCASCACLVQGKTDTRSPSTGVPDGWESISDPTKEQSSPPSQPSKSSYTLQKATVANEYE